VPAHLHSGYLGCHALGATLSRPEALEIYRSSTIELMWIEVEEGIAPDNIEQKRRLLNRGRV